MKYGVISSGAKTAFWVWLTGGGLIHVWTGSESMDIAKKLHLMLVDVVLLDHMHPGPRHPVWSAARVQVMVWKMGPSNPTVPKGWKGHDVLLWHLELGGVTNGMFRFQLGLWLIIDNLPPRSPVGVTLTLHQVIKPTLML
jgi:hypothetical protein